MPPRPSITTSTILEPELRTRLGTRSVTGSTICFVRVLADSPLLTSPRSLQTRSSAVFLKSLAVRGFKSFADRTTLGFEPGISVVVGPNGSGKSNLVDAIIWVLGEQGPATLRSGKMEDVIFGGSLVKPPLGMAEVTLTIDNSARLLPVEFSEVSISRTLFRSGDSEYRLNGATCRLLDIQELLSDAGVGREQHTIVGQGRLDQVLGADVSQMRGFIEDAAGVGKHRRRKERALRKIASTDANLEQLHNLLSEIRRQLRPLRQQAELAQRHESIAAELKLVKLILAARELAVVRSQIGPGDHQEVGRREQELAVLDQQLAGLQQTRLAGASQVAQRREVQWRLRAVGERLGSIGKLAEERQRTLAAELSVNNEAVEQARMVELGVQLAELEAALPAVSEEHQTCEAALSATLSAAERLRAKLRSADELVASGRRAQADALSRAGDLRRTRARLVGSKESTQREANRLEERLGSAERSAQQAQEALEEASREAQIRRAEQEPAARAVEEAEARVTELEALGARLLEQIRELEKQAAVHRARAGAKAPPDINSAARMAELRTRFGAFLLSELVELAPGHKRALEALVGPLDAVVVAEDGSRAVQLVTDHNPDEAITVLVNRTLPEVAEARKLIASARTVDGQDVRAEQALAGIYRASTLVEAIALAGRHPHGIFVTDEGALAMGSIVSRGSSELADAIERCEQEISDAREGMAELQDQLRRARQRIEMLRSARRAADVAYDRAAETVRLAEGRLHGVQGEIAQLTESIAANRHSLGAVDERIAGTDLQIGQAEQAASAHDAGIAEAVAGQEAAQQEFEAAARATEEARVTSGVAQERRREVAERIEKSHSALAAASRRLAGAGKRQQQLLDARVRAARVARVVQAAVAGSAGWAGEATVAVGVATAEIARTDQQLAELASLRRGDAQVLEQLRSRVRREDLGRSELMVRCRLLEARLVDDLQTDPDEAVARWGAQLEQTTDQVQVELERRLGAQTPEALRRRQLRLERDLEQIGAINPLAAREAEALAEREEVLATQIDDLKASRKDLREIVESVDGKIKLLFTAAFADVAREYEHLFRILFPNGCGQLKLTEPHELLHSGVEVEASPQGRSLKRLTLLSGGERALCALALLFAIFKARPSPFYILDEVEAALDDVNLQRFLGLLNEFRGTSQLLVVTHQKRTMEIADVLYGVTLRPDGVSKVISERLSELFPPPPIGVNERGTAQ
ncbi:MAG: chromosome segregation protein SMC [Actinomycetota bacterium]